MKKVKEEGGAGLYEWLSYQSRARAAAQRESDVVDWDEGMEVKEEWLPRELCEQRLREETTPKIVAPVRSGSVHSLSPVIELDEVPLTPQHQR